MLYNIPSTRFSFLVHCSSNLFLPSTTRYQHPIDHIDCIPGDHLFEYCRLGLFFFFFYYNHITRCRLLVIYTYIDLSFRFCFLSCRIVSFRPEFLSVVCFLVPYLSSLFKIYSITITHTLVFIFFYPLYPYAPYIFYLPPPPPNFTQLFIFLTVFSSSSIFLNFFLDI